MLKKINTFLF